jgi:hypothetical protein
MKSELSYVLCTVRRNNVCALKCPDGGMCKAIVNRDPFLIILSHFHIESRFRTIGAIHTRVAGDEVEWFCKPRQHTSRGRTMSYLVCIIALLQIKV